MERKSYTITLYKKDARCRDGKMTIWYSNFELNNSELAAELQKTEKIARHYMDPRKIIIEVKPFRTVTNLMTGKKLEIAADTPLCCDPSSETFWTM